MAKKKKADKKEQVEDQNTPVENHEEIEGQELEATADQEGNEVEVEFSGAKEEGSDSETSSAEEDDQLLMLKELQKVKGQAEEARNQYLRLMAEFDNFRKRTRREMDAFREYASEGVLKALLPVLDDFNRTVEALDKTDNLASLKEGVVMVNNKLFRVLEKEGLQAIESKGQPFDSELHEAIHSVPIPDEEQKGKVLEEVEKGYRLKDKVIRYAKVVVGE